MAIRNKKLKQFEKVVKRFEGQIINLDNDAIIEQVPRYNYLSGNNYVDIRSGNIFEGTQYDVLRAPFTSEVVDNHKTFNISNGNHKNVRLLEFPYLGVKYEAVVAYDETGYEIQGEGGLLISDYLDYYYEELSSEDFSAPKDFEVVIKSKYEIENIFSLVLLVFIGGACIEIIRGDPDTIPTELFEAPVYHRFLTEGWANKYGSDILKNYYTDAVLGEATDYIQGDESRNAALAVLAPAVIENSGFDAGNTSNLILENLKFAYYTKPLKALNNSSFNRVLSFDSSVGSAYVGDENRGIFVTDASSLLNDESNKKSILYNIFFDVPTIESFSYIYLKCDFSTLLNIRDETRSITSYINAKYTGDAFPDVTNSIKLNSNILFDSIGLIDFRYYDKKLQRWMSTNIVNTAYYISLYDNIDDPLEIVRSAITANGDTEATLSAMDSTNYNPFFDYENSLLIINTGDSGELDYSNVDIRIAVKPGFIDLVYNENIACDGATKINYAICAIDNQFELEDKSFIDPSIVGKKLLWFSTPPIVQHIGDGNDIDAPSLAQFRIIDDVFGPSEATLTYGAALSKNVPLDVFRCLRSIRIE